VSESYVVSILACDGAARYYRFDDKSEAVEEYVKKMLAGIEMQPFAIPDREADITHINEVFMEVFRSGANKLWFSSGEFLCEHEEVPGSTSP